MAFKRTNVQTTRQTFEESSHRVISLPLSMEELRTPDGRKLFHHITALTENMQGNVNVLVAVQKAGQVVPSHDLRLSSDFNGPVIIFGNNLVEPARVKFSTGLHRFAYYAMGSNVLMTQHYVASLDIGHVKFINTEDERASNAGELTVSSGPGQRISASATAIHVNQDSHPFKITVTLDGENALKKGIEITTPNTSLPYLTSGVVDMRTGRVLHADSSLLLEAEERIKSSLRKL